MDISNGKEWLQSVFSCEQLIVENVKIVDKYAFIRYKDRNDAQKALNFYESLAKRLFEFIIFKIYIQLIVYFCK